MAWPNLEPEKGKWNFRDLDKLVDLASSHGVQVLLPLGLSPAWASARPGEPSVYEPGFAAEPRDIKDWENYVRTVATRYKGRVHCYEIWNEPNSKGFFTGSVAQMLELTRAAYSILKKIDPSVIVVSPSAVGENVGPGWLEEFLKRGGGEYVDIIGFHFYVDPKPPEAVTALINKVRSLMTKYNTAKPVWNTEAGWDTEKKNFKTDDEAAAYVARSYILNWACGVDRFYWYAWDNWRYLQMINRDYTRKATAAAYAEIQKWLVGARMTSCASGSNGVWTCKIFRDGGYAAWIMWSPAKTVTMYVPNAWGVQYIRDLKGGVRAVNHAAKVEIGPSPVLLGKTAQ